jgi:RyR domain-containing protein
MASDSESRTLRIAQVCHEAIRAFCAALGDSSQVAWRDAPEWQRQSTISGVQFHLANPSATDAATHDKWLFDKEKDGWRYGPVKNPDKKEHPAIVPFDQLPPEEQAKDRLFGAVVRALDY